jgi:hypothetical protein
MMEIFDEKCDVVVRKKGDKFFLLLPSRQIIVESQDLESGYRQLEEEWKRVRNDLNTSGLTDYLESEKRADTFLRSKIRFLPFWVKVIVVGVLLWVIGLFGIQLFGQAMDQIEKHMISVTRLTMNEIKAEIYEIPEKIIFRLPVIINEKFDNLSEQDRREFLRQVQLFSTNVRPLFSEWSCGSGKELHCREATALTTTPSD